jgi:hypothetical protein
MFLTYHLLHLNLNFHYFLKNLTFHLYLNYLMSPNFLMNH